jgi:two-component system sensor histidine kinase BarA
MSGGDEEAAKETLQLILDSLSQDYQTIQNFYAEKKYDSLENEVHRLHGSLCYTGIPLLKIATKELELVLRKKDYTQLEQRYSSFQQELEKFITEARRLNLVD